MLVAAEKLGGTGHTEVDSQLSQHSRGTILWERRISEKERTALSSVESMSEIQAVHEIRERNLESNIFTRGLALTRHDRALL